MTTSGTYAFSMGVGEMILQAFRRIGVPRAAVDQDKLADGRYEMNLLFSDWSNNGPNLWQVDQQSVTLVPGVATIQLAASTVDILDAWITSNGVDRVVTSISRDDYDGYPNKLQVGPPVAFWFNRQTVPAVTLWPIPDTTTTYLFNYSRFRQSQDAAMSSGQTPDVPYRWIDALVWELASRLSFIHAPDKTQMVAAKAKAVRDDAASADVENAPMTFTPMISGYFR